MLRYLPESAVGAWLVNSLGLGVVSASTANTFVRDFLVGGSGIDSLRNSPSPRHNCGVTAWRRRGPHSNSLSPACTFRSAVVAGRKRAHGAPGAVFPNGLR